MSMASRRHLIHSRIAEPGFFVSIVVGAPVSQNTTSVTVAFAARKRFMALVCDHGTVAGVPQVKAV
jgi:hypothetical protein